MMGAAMLKRHQFVRSLWALYRLDLVVSSMWGSQAQPLYHHKTKVDLTSWLSRMEKILLISRLSLLPGAGVKDPFIYIGGPTVERKNNNYRWPHCIDRN